MLGLELLGSEETKLVGNKDADFKVVTESNGARRRSAEVEPQGLFRREQVRGLVGLERVILLPDKSIKSTFQIKRSSVERTAELCPPQKLLHIHQGFLVLAKGFTGQRAAEERLIERWVQRQRQVTILQRLRVVARAQISSSTVAKIPSAS